MGDSKVDVIIKHRAPGIQPPLYLAGSFSNPQWIPQLMECATGDDGVHTFTKTVEVEPQAKYQYKFRVGEGDWWILNEDAPTVTDDSGNRNNLLEAPAESPQAVGDHTPEGTSVTAEAVSGPIDESAEEQTETPIQRISQHGDSEVEEPKPATQLKALAGSGDVNREDTGTPDFVKTSIEVADTAAVLDRPTPVPDESSKTIGEDQATQPSTTPGVDAADTAAEVADTAALLDAEKNEAQSEIGSTSVHPVQDAATTAAEVADTAEALDREKPSPRIGAESLPTPPNDNAAQVAAEVADTAATLDANEPTAQIETAPPAYQTGADDKADMKDDNPEVAGHTDGPEAVPLFAHECAGLYEDDEIPGADDVENQSKTSGTLNEHHSQDFADPTLEKLPTTRDGIISAVRRVSTSLNEDQTSFEGVPRSPIVDAQRGPVIEEDSSPASNREQQALSLPRSHSQRSLSEHSGSLQSIAEGAEEEEAEKDVPEDIASVVEPVALAHDNTTDTKEPETEETKKSVAAEVAPAVEQAHTAEDVVHIAQAAEGEQTGATTPTNGEPVSTAVKAPTASKESVSKDEEISLVSEDATPAALEIPQVEETCPAAEGDILPTGESLQIAQETPIMVDDELLLTREIGSASALTENGDTATQMLKEIENHDTLTTPPKPTLESLVTVPSPAAKANTDLSPPISDEDEAVVLKSSKGDGENTESRGPRHLMPEGPTNPKLEEPSSPRESQPTDSDLVDSHNLENDASKTNNPPVSAAPQSPQRVASGAKETPVTEDIPSTVSLGGSVTRDNEGTKKSETSEDAVAVEDAEAPKGDEGSKDLEVPEEPEASGHKKSVIPEELQAPQYEPEDTSSRSEFVAASSAVEPGQSGSLKKRNVAQAGLPGRTGTPNSITDPHREAAKGGNWFSAFFRLIFIDLFGGFVTKICGGRRKTLVATVAVLATVGLVSYRRAKDMVSEVD